jgi:hypothetical protein
MMIVTVEIGSVYLWNLTDGALLHTLEGTATPAAFLADGRLLIAMGDGIVETWGIPD